MILLLQGTDSRRVLRTGWRAGAAAVAAVLSDPKAHGSSIRERHPPVAGPKYDRFSACGTFVSVSESMLSTVFDSSDDRVYIVDRQRRIIGDAIMAVFMDANDAVAAGRKVRWVLVRLNATRQACGLEEVRIRVGINSGCVVQGGLGPSNRKDVAGIGEVVNAAARIESVANPMHIGISEATYARLHDPRGRIDGATQSKSKAGWSR